MRQNMQNREKNTPNIIESNLKHDYKIYDFWHTYFWHNWLLNDCLSSHLTHCLLLQYVGKSDQAKYALK